MSSPGGAEFFERRLRRACAVPAAERSPEVAAFLESTQLLRAACQLMPLNEDGKASLGTGAAEGRQLQLAWLQVARAYYICPVDRPVAGSCDVARHLSAYNASMTSMVACCGMPPLSDMLSALMTCLPVYSGSGSATQKRPELVRLLALMPLQHTIERLSDPAQEATLSSQLSELSAGLQPQPQLTVTQLLSLCLRVSISISQHLLMLRTMASALEQPTVRARLPDHVTGLEFAAHSQRHADAVCEAMSSSVRQLLEVEPNNAASHEAAANVNCSSSCSGNSLGLALEAAEEWYRVDQLGRQQGSSYWAVAGTVGVMTAVLACKEAMNAEKWEQHLKIVLPQALQQVEVMMGPLRRILPEAWVAHLEIGMHTLKANAARETAALGNSGGGTGGGGGTSTAAGRTGDTAQDLGRLLLRSNVACDGCHKAAVGLRKCAGCRQMHYCSRECQVKHWKQGGHKQQCALLKAAAASGTGDMA